jgi:hypothetical protein
MHFMDPKELGGLRVIGRNDVILGVVEGIYADIRSGYPQWAAIQSGLFGRGCRRPGAEREAASS